MIDDNRIHALALAAREHELLGRFKLVEGEDANTTLERVETGVLTSAERYLAWLRGPIEMQVTVGPAVKQNHTSPPGDTNPGGPAMSIVFLDDEQAPVTIRPLDGKGFESGDALVYEGADPTVVTVVPADAADTHHFTAVAGVPGVTSVKATDPTALDADGAPLSVLIAVEVSAAGAESFDVAVGAPVKQPPAEAPPADAPPAEEPAVDAPPAG